MSVKARKVLIFNFGLSSSYFCFYFVFIDSPPPPHSVLFSCVFYFQILCFFFFRTHVQRKQFQLSSVHRPMGPVEK